MPQFGFNDETFNLIKTLRGTGLSRKDIATELTRRGFERKSGKKIGVHDISNIIHYMTKQTKQRALPEVETIHFTPTDDKVIVIVAKRSSLKDLLEQL